MKDLYDVPRKKVGWESDNPYEAAQEFIQKHPDFEIEVLAWLFSESKLTKDVTYWPGAWIRETR